MLLAAAIGMSLAVAAPAAAAGTDRYVAVSGSDAENDCTDASAPCRTIQYAVLQADSGDTIHIGAGSYDESVQIRMSLTLLGAGTSGASRTSVTGDGADAGITIDGTDTDGAPDVTIGSLDVSHVAGASGVSVDAATLVLEASTVVDNDEEGLRVTGTSASATVQDSSVSGNLDEGILVEGDASAHLVRSSVDDNARGGVVVLNGSATIDTSTLDGNLGAGTVAAAASATVAVTDSTISNTDPFSDGVPDYYGAAVLVLPGGAATVTGSTLDGNTGQGVLVLETGTASVSASTIAGTEPGQDDAIPSGGATKTGQGGSLTLTATIVGDNVAPNCSGTVGDGGYNLSDTASCGFSATGSISGGTASLANLAENGGPTKTRLPAKTGDAVDRIPSGTAGCASDATDQRGEPRLQGSGCDIGAVELGQPPLVVTPSVLPQGTVGQPYSTTLQASGGLGAPYTFALADGSSLPDGLTLSASGVISGTPTAAGTTSFTVAVDDPTFVPLTIVIAPATAPAALAESGADIPVTGLLGAGGIAVLLGIVLLLAFATRRAGDDGPTERASH
ncbi:hypothetical protein GCM10009840_08290 [Pseudolysinimonas kribbensis]|uniref:Right handed beta helix domain-containing protein n=1 Tax=Pseudolysinimonas kribbensis TaxID=433641 RepID=A0ABQ6K7G1_9MICO|nr:hypothetical protein GCM10025881_20480 [Pseudolysinimonas kribbensis]